MASYVLQDQQCPKANDDASTNDGTDGNSWLASCRPKKEQSDHEEDMGHERDVGEKETEM